MTRAEALYAAGRAANTDMRPVLAARRLRAALRALGEAPAVAVSGETGPADLLRGRILVTLALAESEQGRIETGLRLLGEAEAFLPPGERGVLHGQRGMLLRRTGRDDLALEEYAAALAVLTERGESEGMARVLLNRAVLHMAAVRSGLARADLRRCLELATRHGLGHLAVKARHNLGYLDYLAGDIPSALRRYASAARDYTELIPGMLPVLSLDRARALLAAGLFVEADRELATALAQLGAQRLSQDHAEAHLARAEASLLAGRPAAARTWARRAHALFRRRDNPRWAARALLVVLRADHATGARPAAVAQRARTIEALMRGLGLPEDARVAGLLGARALVASGEVDRAARAVAAGAPGRADRLDTRLLWRLASAEVAASAGRRRESSRHLVAGLHTLQRYRSQLGNLDLQTGAAVHGRDLARRGLSAALATGSVGEIFRWAERVRAQALLTPQVRPPQDPEAAAALEELRGVRVAMRQAELSGRPARALRLRGEALQRTIREHAWFAAGTRGQARQVLLAQIRAELGEAAMVLYLPDGPDLRALVLAGGRAKVVRLGRIADAEEALLRLRADLDAQAGRAMPERLSTAVRAATRRNAAMLGALVLDPLLDLVGDRDIVVVPTGILVTVPWSVLPAAAGRPVTVAPSASTWSAARSRLLGRVEPSTRTLLVAGPGNDRGVPEVAAIAELRAKATVLIGSAATPAATLAAFAEADLAHVAAHGHHHTDNALFSGLELEGGPLMGYDLQHLPNTPAMVVLSSCDLGLHDVRPGDETLGMATALLSAGASTVVASVGRVADEAAMSVMTAYHRALGDGLPPAAALAVATPADSLAGFICFGAG
ncbi:tetratricopeptide (TPR) repeat protein [Allocatelliglobosispora scoriae]|uniref:Tetratricopeptide (TPR) repeat protein n=1 Tax=Allocatelliglobosispora scoriae TaxID=643052 RepID=A0A841C168_9ACTN|nr:CHAT domain-containing protein [Allocatelliglobosispora scoriae]MBB5872621.1 tetratricopeptide (TPR) repeat protein [Allocatelliglobosispora scoriae]